MVSIIVLIFGSLSLIILRLTILARRRTQRELARLHSEAQMEEWAWRVLCMEGEWSKGEVPVDEKERALRHLEQGVRERDALLEQQRQEIRRLRATLEGEDPHRPRV